jgi:hypothetical protein
MCATLALLLLASAATDQDPQVQAQTQTQTPTETPTQTQAVPPPEPVEEDEWEFSGSVFYSHPADSPERLTPILYADRGQLHLEARYNYEDLHTGSVFFGWNFSGGEEFTHSFTPMIGAVAGDTRGIAPGLEFDLGWKKVAWYAEAEYLFDMDDNQDDFFYCWSTLTYGLTDWLDAGVVTERSRLVDTGLSLQRGLALKLHKNGFGLALYAYNIGSDDSYEVVSFDVTR